jgi:hypothetical protein
MLVKQRDNEIAILLNYLNKKKAEGADPGIQVHTRPHNDNSSSRHNDSTRDD